MVYREPQPSCLPQRRGLVVAVRGPFARPGFSLIDVLVSLSVIAVLIALLVPSLSGIREATRKVVCANNVRQLTLGATMYADDYRDYLPQSVFNAKQGKDTTQSVQKMTIVRIGGIPTAWDGLGVLYTMGYTPAVGTYYCPSNTGPFRLSEMGPQWTRDDATLISNYQYRGASVDLVTLRRRQPNYSFITDSCTSAADFSHRNGANVSTIDNAVFWYQDTGTVAGLLPGDVNDSIANARINAIWQQFDLAANSTAVTGGSGSQ